MMKNICILILVLLTTVSGNADNNFTIESAVGIPSDECYEFALKGEYSLNPFISFSLMSGFVEDKYRYIPVSGDVINVEWRFSEETGRVNYILPSVKFSARIFRIDLGGIFFTRSSDSLKLSNPFDREKRIQPAYGIELGESDFYAFYRSLVSLPLYKCGGPFEIGVGMVVSGGNEHKVYYSQMNESYSSLGYKGEIGIYKSTALILGFTIGGRKKDNFYSMITGFKTAL
ncbi:MAG: hypothetical protein GY839_13990 [candidate division Zixibacteria bacterium]|nr:hypothetical protein [candidate division Zixibacteria bacterium]